MTRFGVDLAGMVHGEFAPGARDVVLTVRTSTTWKAGGDQGKNKTTTDYPCRGYKVEFDSSLIDGTNVRTEDCMIRIYRRSLASSVEPTSKDRVTLGGVNYEIVAVKGDDIGGSMWVLHVRGPGRA